MLLYHVFASHTSPHISEISKNFPEIFDLAENRVISVKTAAAGFSVLKDAADEKLPRVLTWRRFLLYALFSRPDCLVVHGMYWPRVWLVLTFLSIIRVKLVLVSWGGELRRTEGAKAFLRSLLVRYVLKKALKVIFLSSTDEKIAREAFPVEFRSDLIPYYNRKHERRVSCVSTRIPGNRLPNLNVQVGNDGTKSNDHIRCIKLIAKSGINGSVFLPLGYGRHDEEYITSLLSVCRACAGVEFNAFHSMMTQDQFDDNLDMSDVLLLGVTQQKALYSIFSYLSMGKPVFLPKDGAIFGDLVDLGFNIFDLDQFPTIIHEQMTWKIASDNRDVAVKVLSSSAIRSKWMNLLLSLERGTRCD